MSLVLCSLAFLAAFLAGRMSLVAGVGAVFGAGYVYGIARANLMDTASYFLFDAAVAGLYLAAAADLFQPHAAGRYASMKVWLGLLIGWPLLLLAIPVQDYLIQLVGFRANVLLLPFILIGAQFDERRVFYLALWLAVLNLGAFALACVEYQIGIEPFFPRSPVTELMYRSTVGATSSAYRIPASFANAHAYGGTMARSLPWLLVAWIRPGQPTWQRLLLTAGIGASMLGVLASSTRVSAGLMFAVLAVFSFSPEVRGWFRLTWIALFGGVAYIVSGRERLQRFIELTDVDAIAERVHNSVNMSFVELLQSYPMGNGLGGGGTSIPAFLTHRLSNPIGMENEYSRLLLELGVLGLLIWLGFFAWLAGRVLVSGRLGRSLTVRLFAVTILADVTLSLLGTGMLTSIPGTVLLMLHIGFVARDLPTTTPAGRVVARVPQ